MNRKDLLELAKERGVVGRSKMDKGALLAALAGSSSERDARKQVNGGSRETDRAGIPDRLEGERPNMPSENGYPSSARPASAGAGETPREAASAPGAGRREPGRFDNRRDRNANRAQQGRPSRGNQHQNANGSDLDEDDRWNRAGGRDPNYGRFLDPGASPLHQSGRHRPGRGPQGRHDRDARADRARSQLRRTGEARQGVGYVPQFNRPSGSGVNPRDPRQNDRSRRGRPRDDRGRPQQNRARDAQRHDNGGPRPQQQSAPHGEGRGRDRRHSRGGRNERKGDRRFDLRANTPVPGANTHSDRRAAQERPREEVVDRAAAQTPRTPDPVRPPDRSAPRRRNESFETLGKIGPLTPEELKKELERELAAREAAHGAPRMDAAGQTSDPSKGKGTARRSNPETKLEPGPSGHPLELPEPLRADHCRVLARDPYWIHAYWKISPSSLSRARQELGDQTMRRILRVHSLPMELRRLATVQPPGFFDIEVGDEVDNWYIHVGIPERTYRVDVGLLAENGLFYPLAVSNRVTTPPDKMSDQVDPKWKSSDQEAKELYELSGGSPVAQISHEPPAREHAAPRDRDANPRGVPESEVSSSGGETPAVGLREPDSISDDLAFVADPAPTTRDIQAHADGAPHDAPASMERKGRRSFGFVDAADNRPEPAAESWGASEARPTPPQEDRGEFWFVLHTEVILSGATEPDATVTIQGTPVRLRPDGTFSVRFQLPDGEQTIPVVAVSSDGSSTRRITPKITRETTRAEYDRHSSTEEGPHGEAGGSDVTE